jgi:hypothetical protein
MTLTLVFWIIGLQILLQVLVLLWFMDHPIAVIMQLAKGWPRHRRKRRGCWDGGDT